MYRFVNTVIAIGDVRVQRFLLFYCYFTLVCHIGTGINYEFILYILNIDLYVNLHKSLPASN